MANLSQRTAHPTPAYARIATARSTRIFVGVGICTHPLLAVDKFQTGAPAFAARQLAGRLSLPCHGSTFDLAGRVFKNKPAPDNLEVPPHMYLSDTVMLIGEDKKA